MSHFNPPCDLVPHPDRPLEIVDSAPAFGDLAAPGGLSEYLRLLRRKKLVVTAFLLFGLAAGCVAILLQAPLYRGRTTLEIQSLNERFMNMTEVDPGAGAGNYAATDANLQTQIKILQSDLVRNRALERVERETIPMAPAQDDLFAVLRSRLKLAPREPAEATRLAIRRAARSLDAGVLRSTRIVEIRCESTSPEVAANLVNTLANEYITQTLEARVKSTERTREWLTKELAALKAKLERSESELQNYVRQAGLLFVEQQNTLADAKLKQLQMELSTIQADRIAKQARFEMAVKSPPDALPDILDDSILRAYQGSLTDLRRQYAELTSTLTPAHKKVREVQAQITEVEAAQRKARESILQRIRNDYESAQRRERLLAAAYGGQSHQVTQQADRELQYNILKREAEINRQMYNTTLQQVNQAQLAAGIPNTNVRVIDVGTPPSLPDSPIPLLDLGIGLGSGLLFGCVFVILHGRADRSVRLPGHATNLLNVQELAVIPMARFSPAKPWLLRMRLGMGRPKPTAVELATWHSKPSLLAESFRVCLPALLYGEVGGRPVRVIVVTSPSPGEGKTTCAANLAIAMAETNRQVLLVDGDFRSPRLHQVFGVPQTAGLSNIISSDQPLEHLTLGSLAQQTDIPGLFVLTNDSAEVNLSRLHYSPRTRQVFERLRLEFDMVIIDTPPMLQFFDARVLARLSDGVVLVVRSGSTDRDSVIAAGRRLGQDGVPLLGTILNDWDPTTAEQKKYHSYYGRKYQDAG